MSYLYSKLPETGVSPHIGTEGSGDPAQDYLPDVITEGLTAYLSRIRGSFVIARTTAFTYKGRTVDVKQIGRILQQNQRAPSVPM